MMKYLLSRPLINKDKANLSTQEAPVFKGAHPFLSPPSPFNFLFLLNCLNFPCILVIQLTLFISISHDIITIATFQVGSRVNNITLSTVTNSKSQEMDSKFRKNNRNSYTSEQDQDTDHDVAQENIAESPPSSTVFNIDGLVPSPTSSSKRRLVLLSPSCYLHIYLITFRLKSKHYI